MHRKLLLLLVLVSSLALGQQSNPLFSYPPKLVLGQLWKVSVQDVGDWTVLVNRQYGTDGTNDQYTGFALQSGDPAWRIGMEKWMDNLWYLWIYRPQDPKRLKCEFSWAAQDEFDSNKPLSFSSEFYSEQDGVRTSFVNKTCSFTLEQIGLPLPTPNPLYSYPPKLETGQRWTVQFDGLGTWSAVLSRGGNILEGETTNAGERFTLQAELEPSLTLRLINRQRKLECQVNPQLYDLDSSQAFEASYSSYRIDDTETSKPCRIKLEQVGVALAPSIGTAPSSPASRSSGCNGKAQTGFVGKLSFLGATRQFQVKIPQTKNIPSLVFIFHGRTNPDVSFIRLNSEMVHVYPLGMPNLNERWWNAKDKSGSLRDYKFFDAMLEFLKKNVCFDQKRIYAIGYSLGASFVNSLGCMRPIIRAFATLGGGILEPKCPKPVAAMILHSPRDELVPIKEGIRARDVLLRSNKLQNKTQNYPKTADLLPSEDFSSFKCQRYLGSQNFPVVWCPHELSRAVWGQVGYYHAWMAGTNELIWKFFSGLATSGF